MAATICLRAIILRELAKGDPSFLERRSPPLDGQRCKWHHIFRRPKEFCPDPDEILKIREALPNCWWVETNLDDVFRKTVIGPRTKL